MRAACAPPSLQRASRFILSVRWESWRKPPWLSARVGPNGCAPAIRGCKSDVRSAQAEAGAVVRVTDERGRFHGRAFYSDKSQIAVRLLTHHNVPVDRDFFAGRLRRAATFRQTVVENTDACRLVYGEADQLPSVIVDRYGDYFVLQTLSQGIGEAESAAC